ncbi:PglL family O-oligosaccharyltransferase [Acinetobacter johnsonii]|uniref:Wzy polymerase domain-containing protein n=1 Tax=Acinetobacter johnsonii TaxID=40214 RepID=A0AAW6RU76_ACIJO|nr:O-antigen ligase family protein [Acinetobacter johnsonii]MDG9786944.1 Wzy polymerase domain-containing protein [Acinetobacter johnsonii]MDG9797946.1 Wzy polymerase domain-containing protein [Acinetobacter johnsonii]
MIRIFIFFTTIFFVSAWLIPIHLAPWVAFESEILAALSALIVGFLVIILNKKIVIPKVSTIFLLLISIPIIQYFFGQVIYLSTAMLGSGYLLLFYIMIISGYNLQEYKSEIFLKISYLFIFIGVVSSIVCIIQWLNLDGWLTPYILELKGNRPYANVAQPNNLATLLVLSLLSIIYVYEKMKWKISTLIILILLIFFALVLAQSRTAWISISIISIFLFYKNKAVFKKFSNNNNLSFLLILVVFITLIPLLNSVLLPFIGADAADVDTLVERFSSGYLRLEMWYQAFIAIKESVWFGYGWNQVGLAQMEVFNTYPTTEWYKSSHNIFLDLVIWFGIPVGLFFIVYFFIGLLRLLKHANNVESVIGFSFLLAILIHSCLEYPLYYAFILFPFGFIVGLIYPKILNADISVNKLVFCMPLIFILIFIYLLVSDYYLYKKKLVLINMENLTLSQENINILSDNLVVLTEFSWDLWWRSLNPENKFSDAQIEEIRIHVWNHASEYNLYKYAQVLAFNNRKKEALNLLWIISKLHKKEYLFEELITNKASESF